MKVVFDLSMGRLVIEGDGPELLKVLESARTLAPSVSQIQIVTGGNSTTNGAANTLGEDGDDDYKPPKTPLHHRSGPKTLRQFARSLALENTSERIAAIAYYINKIEGKPSFSPKELDGWFTMCGFQKPSQMPVAIFDAKRKYGFLENISRGSWKISNQGENLILAKIEMATDE